MKLALRGGTQGRSAERPSFTIDLSLRVGSQKGLTGALGSKLSHDVEGMTINEIGAALGLSRDAVKGCFHRARAVLRDHLLDY